jgi:uncharacterized protein with PIN domain
MTWFHARAEHLSRSRCITPAHALSELHGRALRAERLLAKARSSRVPHELPISARPRFLCDAGLGGLARWIRAAGYEATWIPDIDDDDLLREGERRQTIILTTDSMLMERRVLRDGILPAVWLPPTLTMREQLALLFAELGLEPRESRCMSCGGELVEVDKEKVRERIPPRTYLWKNEYFECSRCGKLFWHGTHWDKIVNSLRRL